MTGGDYPRTPHKIENTGTIASESICPGLRTYGGAGTVFFEEGLRRSTPQFTAHGVDHLGEPFFMSIAFGAEPVVSFTSGIYFLRGLGSRLSPNRRFLLPAWRGITRGEDTRIELGLGLAPPSLRHRRFDDGCRELVEQPEHLAYVAVQLLSPRRCRRAPR